MDASTEPQTPEEAAALRALAVKHQRRHRWIALFWSLCVSVHTTVILYTVCHNWPLDARDLVGLVFFVVNTDSVG
jgi:membrane protein YdbS with pleckstrin-like domain